MPLTKLHQFVRLEAFGGMVLCAAAVAAIVMANSRLGAFYVSLLDVPFSIQTGGFAIAKPLLLWINDGLMAIFFLIVGLEVKREILEGGLSSVADAALPAIAALGGIVGPVLIYLAFAAGDPGALRGWAIPAATDIAFALGVLALLGSRAPSSLKVFLLALAIIDDLGVIIIIAVFYTADLSVVALALAGAGTVAIILLNLTGVSRRSAYILLGIFIWVCVLKSGIHTTLAGVVVGLAMPMRVKGGGSPLVELEHDLHPWVAYGVLPVFAFANAGVRLTDVDFSDLLHPVQLGIGMGLFVGKQAGVIGSIWVAVRLGRCALPDGVTWRQMYGLALLTGIGFTMSLFVSTLAFEPAAYDADVRVPILIGSVASAIGGYLVLFTAARRGPAGTRAASGNQTGQNAPASRRKLITETPETIRGPLIPFLRRHLGCTTLGTTPQIDGTRRRWGNNAPMRREKSAGMHEGGCSGLAPG